MQHVIKVKKQTNKQTNILDSIRNFGRNHSLRVIRTMTHTLLPISPAQRAIARTTDTSTVQRDCNKLRLLVQRHSSRSSGSPNWPLKHSRRRTYSDKAYSYSVHCNCMHTDIPSLCRPLSVIQMERVYLDEGRQSLDVIDIQYFFVNEERCPKLLSGRNQGGLTFPHNSQTELGYETTDVVNKLFTADLPTVKLFFAEAFSKQSSLQHIANSSIQFKSDQFRSAVATPNVMLCQIVSAG